MINPDTDINTEGLLMKKFPYPAPLEQSVLGALPAIWTDETDRLKCPTWTPQLCYEQSCLQSSARTMSYMDIVNHTDVNDDMNTDLPESLAPMLKSPTVFEWPYVNSSTRPMLNPGIVNQTEVTFDMDTYGEFSSDDRLGLDGCRSERRTYSILMFGNEWITRTAIRTAGDTADRVNMCRTVAQDERWSNTDDNSDTDSVAEWEYNTWDDECAWECRNVPVIIPPGLVQNPLADIMRNYTEDDEYPENVGDVLIVAYILLVRCVMIVYV